MHSKNSVARELDGYDFIDGATNDDLGRALVTIGNLRNLAWYAADEDDPDERTACQHHADVLLGRAVDNLRGAMHEAAQGARKLERVRQRERLAKPLADLANAQMTVQLAFRMGTRDVKRTIPVRDVLAAFDGLARVVKALHEAVDGKVTP